MDIYFSAFIGAIRYIHPNIVEVLWEVLWGFMPENYINLRRLWGERSNWIGRTEEANVNSDCYL